jgi:hypothetical protein
MVCDRRGRILRSSEISSGRGHLDRSEISARRFAFAEGGYTGLPYEGSAAG